MSNTPKQPKRLKAALVLGASIKVALASSAAYMITAATVYTQSSAYSVYCSNCSTRWQQALEFVEAADTQLNTAQQLATQVKQYNDMIKQGIKLPQKLVSDIQQDLSAVAAVYQNTQTLGRGISTLDQDFREQYSGFEDFLGQNIPQASQVSGDQYKKLASDGYNNAKSALAAAGLNVSTFQAEGQQLQQLLTASQNSQGRMQAIQAGNQIAASNVQQLQKLRDLMATQITMQSAYIASEVERRAADDATRLQRNTKHNNTNKDMGF